METTSIIGVVSNTLDVILNAPHNRRIKMAQALSTELEVQKNQITIQREELKLWNDAIETIKKLNELIEENKNNPEDRRIWLELRDKITKKIGLTSVTYDRNAQMKNESKHFLDLYI